MRSHGRIGWTPHQYHARHPYQCFVCQRARDKGSTYTHEETGARTCSPLRFTTYERWWLRKKPHVDPPAPSPLDIAPWSLTNWPNSSVPYASQPDNRNSLPQLQMRSKRHDSLFRFILPRAVVLPAVQNPLGPVNERNGTLKFGPCHLERRRLDLWVAKNAFLARSVSMKILDGVVRPRHMLEYQCRNFCPLLHVKLRSLTATTSPYPISL